MKNIGDTRVAAFKAFQASPISSKTWAFCSCKTGISGAKVRAASHLLSASRYFPSYKKELGIIDTNRTYVTTWETHFSKYCRIQT